MKKTCSRSKCVVCCVAQTLLVIGGVNWGLVGVGGLIGNNLNLVNLIFGRWPVVESIIYILVGLSALASVAGMFLCCKSCDGNSCKEMAACDSADCCNPENMSCEDADCADESCKVENTKKK